MTWRICSRLSWCLTLGLLCGCVGTKPENAPGRPSRYVDSGSPGPIQGIGVESQDITSMSDKMMRDIINTTQIAARKPPALVIIDDQYFKNESSSRLNPKLVTDRLRVELNRAAQGRLYFVSRENIDMVEKERLLKREGAVSQGTLGSTAATAGADFRLTGRIASLDEVAHSGLQSRYHQITFELIDLESSVIAWSGQYEFKKVAQDDVIYR